MLTFPPVQYEGAAGALVIVGNALKVTVTVAVEVQPLAFVPVTV
jgi:hypothetical protein